jgi:D-threo-aldose 1-dehydrogenase
VSKYSPANAFLRGWLGPLGLGTAGIGNLYREVSDYQARATLEAAWEEGIRYYDTAPHYGLGLAERRVGEFLADKPRHEYVVSTKVGRLLVPNPDHSGGMDDADHFAVPDTTVRLFDPSTAGVRRSLEESLTRMGLDAVDIVYLHDPDVYDLEAGIREGVPAIAALRHEGLVKRIGVGTNDDAAAVSLARQGQIDLVMIASRYTLLEQPAAAELLPLCVEHGVSIVAAAPFNSGLLAVPHPGPSAHYDYTEVPGEKLARARRLAEVCDQFGVELPAAALQFPLRHEAVVSVVAGAASPEQVRQNARRRRRQIPESLWDALDRLAAA